jgi:hypothetical protein
MPEPFPLLFSGIFKIWDMKEYWEFVVGSKRMYRISTLGRVRSTGRNQSRNNKVQIMRQSKDTDGYPQLSLYIDGGKHSRKIHRLVATAFIANPENKPCVNHKNGIKTDNRVENLEWCTVMENNMHALLTGLRVIGKGVNGSMAKLTQEEVDEIRKTYDPKIISMSKMGKIYNVSAGTICHIVNYTTHKL